MYEKPSVVTDFYKWHAVYEIYENQSCAKLCSFTVTSSSSSFYWNSIIASRGRPKIQSSWSHHTTLSKWFCLFLLHHLVTSVCLLAAAVYCGKPLVAYSHVINEKTAQYHYPATVRMNCDYGYKRADGSYALRCLANGRWNDTSLRCKRK